MAECKIPEAAMRGVRRVLELEREVTFLRNLLATMPAHAQKDPVWKERIANLLSKIVLFRIALSVETIPCNAGRTSSRKC